MENKYTRLKWLALIIIAGFFFFLAQAAFAGNKSLLITSLPQQQITGKVTDKDGIPLIGVTVMVKGSNTGTITNLEGIYNLPVAEKSTLVFSYIGYKTLEVPFNGDMEIDVQLEENITSLGEVEINAGYYTTTERESTGNISRVTAEEIELQPVISPLQALQGRMAGVEIVPGGNQPGMAPTIRIRGRNSLREDGNFPLYIINGVPINSTPIESNSLLGNTGIDPLNTLNLSNIESIEVLKDADATAIYGSRGANGVVLITTKKGENQKTGLEARVYTGVATVPNRLELLNTEQYLQLRKQAFINDGVEPDQYNAYDLVLWDQNKYTDWQDFFFGGTSSITDVNLTTTQGDENTSYRLSGSYHKQGSVFPGDFNYQKATASISINHTSKDKKWNLNFSTNYGVDISNIVGNVDLTFSALRLPPNAPSIFNEDGSLNWTDWSEAGLDNPLQGFFNTSKTQANNLISSLGVSYEILPGLDFKTNLGYTYFNSEELVKRPKRSYNPAISESINHGSSHLDIDRSSWILEPQLNYSGSFGKAEVNTLVGGTIQESKYSQLGLQGQGYVSETLIGNLSAAESILNASHQNTEYRYAAIFARLGFNWDKKYFLNLTVRRDGSSRFGPGKQFANFGAIGAAWIFTEETFLKKENSFLSFGKLRGSYGTTGNDQIGDYGFLDAYEATPGPGGLYPTQLANANYSWEVNKKLEAGIDLSFLKDRIDLGASWYLNRSSNQLVGFVLPSITGFTTIQANLPATVENTGLELELSTVNIRSKNINWQTFLNITIPKNKLVSYPGIEQSSYANIYKVGQPLNISLLYQYEGIDPETGYYSVADINEDERFDFEDRVVIQDLGRDFYGGITNNISYKNFSLQFLFDFVKQEGTFALFNAGDLSNQRAETFQALDNNSRFQQISASSEAFNAYSRVLTSTFPVVDASFLRLRTLSLAYSLPSKVLGRLPFNNGKIFLNGQNLYTLTKYKGLDPEIPFDGTSFAGLRTITAGLEIQF